MTEGLQPTLLARKACFSDSSTSSLFHNDFMISLRSDASERFLFCWFSSFKKIQHHVTSYIWSLRHKHCPDCNFFLAFKGKKRLTSRLRSLKASMLWEESLNDDSASSLASSFSITVDGAVSRSLHNASIDCFNSLNVFSLFTYNIQYIVSKLEQFSFECHLGFTLLQGFTWLHCGNLTLLFILNMLLTSY